MLIVMVEPAGHSAIMGRWQFEDTGVIKHGGRVKIEILGWAHFN